MLYAGQEASEAFNMLHEKTCVCRALTLSPWPGLGRSLVLSCSVVAKYAPDTIIGTYKQ